MKNLVWHPLLGTLFLAPSFAFSTTYWGCHPQKNAGSDPRIVIAKDKEPGTAFFLFDKDLVREQGKLPAGQYLGELVPSSSGYSLFARLNVSQYFPNASGKGTWLSLPLNLKSPVFLAEAYLLWEDEHGTTQGLIVNDYGCRAKSNR